MRQPGAATIIRMEYGSHSRNFMTPDIIRYGTLSRHFAYEFSTGEGLRRPGQVKADQIWGVSVVEFSPITRATTRRTDLSGCFQSREAAQAHITEMAENLPERTLT